MSTTQPAPTPDNNPVPLLHILVESMNLHQSVFAVAELGVADLLVGGAKTAAELAGHLRVHEDSLYRILRLLASEGIFSQTGARTFANNAVSNCLRTGVPSSLRAMARFRGTEFIYKAFVEIMHTVRTGQNGRVKALGMDGWEYLRRNPEIAQIFDDAMTESSSLVAPGIASAYDFSQWESLMDVGGGNGILLTAILRRYPTLHGVLGDQQHVIERARQRGFLSGEFEKRSQMQPCDLFNDIPAGCRAYVMKSVIHDWNDEDSVRILQNCRKAVPKDGALLLVEFDLPEDASPSPGKYADVTMMLVTGGKERTEKEYGRLLSQSGFQLTQVVPTATGFNVLEAQPV